MRLVDVIKALYERKQACGMAQKGVVWNEANLRRVGVGLDMGDPSEMLLNIERMGEALYMTIVPPGTSLNASEAMGAAWLEGLLCGRLWSRLEADISPAAFFQNYADDDGMVRIPEAELAKWIRGRV